MPHHIRPPQRAVTLAHLTDRPTCGHLTEASRPPPSPRPPPSMPGLAEPIIELQPTEEAQYRFIRRRQRNGIARHDRRRLARDGQPSVRVLPRLETVSSHHCSAVHCRPVPASVIAGSPSKNTAPLNENDTMGKTRHALVIRGPSPAYLKLWCISRPLAATARRSARR